MSPHRRMQKNNTKRNRAIDYSEIPKLTVEFWNTAKLVLPEPKAAISLRVDRDVLDWFKAQGKGYQSLMNAVLRSYAAAKNMGLEVHEDNR